MHATQHAVPTVQTDGQVNVRRRPNRQNLRNQLKGHETPQNQFVY